MEKKKDEGEKIWLQTHPLGLHIHSSPVYGGMKGSAPIHGMGSGNFSFRRCFWCGHTPILGHVIQVSSSSVVLTLWLQWHHE